VLAGAGHLANTRHQVWLAASISLLAAVCWCIDRDPAVPVLAALSVMSIAVAIERPFAVCLIFIVFSFFRLHEAYSFLNPLHLPLLIGVITLGALLWHMFVARSIAVFWSPELKWFVAFFLITSVGAMFAINRQLAFDFWTDTFSKIAVMTLAFAWLPRGMKDFTLAGRVFIISGILVAAVAIHNKLNGVGLVELTRVTVGRGLNSLLGDPNDLALVLLFPLSFSVSYAIHRCGALNRLIGMVGLATIMCAIILTQSRGGLIGIVAVLGVSAYRMTRSKWLLPLFAIAAAYLLYDAMDISDRVSGGADTEGLDESASERLIAWKGAIWMAIYRPLTGVGIANFANALELFTDTYVGRALAPHSTWFGVLGETALPGFIAFVAMVVATLRSSVHSYLRLIQTTNSGEAQAPAFALLMGLIAFCAAGSFLTQGFSWSIYLLVGLTSALAAFVDRTFPPRSTAQ
jgi:O-antigen ligase